MSAYGEVRRLTRWEERTDDGIWLPKTGSECSADVMDGTVVRPCGSDDGVDVLLEEDWAEAETQKGNNEGRRPLILEEQALVCRRF